MTRSGAVVAVVPAFHPPPALAHLVQTLAGQCAAVVVVADGPRSVPAALLAACRAGGATIVEHPTNRGIAAALNTGIRAWLGVDGNAPDAFLTVDQDSTVPDGYVDALVAAWTRAKGAGVPVGLVAPELVTGIPAQVRRHRGRIALGRDPVQSGLLVPTATWHAVGAFDERLFIDGVDADYALRCFDARLRVVVAEGVRLTHRLGDQHAVRVAGRTVTLTRSAPFRYYYLTRNRVRLVLRHGRRHPGWAAGQAVGLVGHIALVQALAPGRADRARAIAAGIRDAARGVAGPRPTR